MGVTRIRSIEAMKRLYLERHVRPLESERQKAEAGLSTEKRKVLDNMYKELMDYALQNYPMLRPKDVCAFKRGDFSREVDTKGFGIDLVLESDDYWDGVTRVRDARENLNRAKNEVVDMTQWIADWEYEATLAVTNRGKVPEFKG